MGFKLTNKLRVARAERNLSQADLAELAGVTRQTICSIETGQYCPSALLAFLIAEKLDKPVAELFKLEGDHHDRSNRGAR
jgi:putative transcriptional regulator